MLVVTSAGNAGGGAWNKLTMPADADSILTVGSVEPIRNRQRFQFTWIYCRW